ncbi:MAG: hypothetical protein FJZ98_02115 [Chloroflexi bacterium]|nr:hypothetical protein [Chloroflexota bacterium]
MGQDQVECLFKGQGIDPNSLSAAEVSGDAGSVIDHIGNLLVQDFGQMSAQGILIRAGRASLIFFRRFFSEVDELGDLQNRLKPVDRRFFHSMEILAEIWSREMGVFASVRKVDRGEFIWSMAVTWSEIEKNQIFLPYFAFGLLEEFCAWLDARKSYRIVFSQPENGELAELLISIQPQE